MANYKITFSPTGGTQKVADILVDALGGQWNAIDLSKKTESISFTERDVCLVSVPSFGGRVPAVAIERLRVFTGGGAKAILVCVYGNRAFEDTLSELQDTLEAAGFSCCAAVAAIAEHSLFRQYAVARPDAEDAAELKTYAAQIAQKLESDTQAVLVLPGAHGEYKPYGGSAIRPGESDKCVSCMLCVSACPVSAISLEAPNKTDADKCISCMRCVSLCPQKARDPDAAMMAAIGSKLGKVLGGHKENCLYI